MKLVYDQLPIGELRSKQAVVPDASLSFCPCCRIATDTPPAHLLQCVSLMLQVQSAICTSDDHPVRYLIWAGISHCWLTNGDDVPFQPHLDEFPPHFPFLHDALDAQQAIGWGNAVKGLFSSRWRHLATFDIDSAKGASRVRSIIQSSHDFTVNTWLSRNSALHQKDDAELARVRSAEIPDIRHYHSSPHLLMFADRQYCSHSLDRLLSGSASTR